MSASAARANAFAALRTARAFRQLGEDQRADEYHERACRLLTFAAREGPFAYPQQ